MKKIIVSAVMVVMVVMAFAQPVKTKERPDFEINGSGFCATRTDSWGDKSYWQYNAVSYEELEEFLEEMKYDGWHVAEQDFGIPGASVIRKNKDVLITTSVYVTLGTDKFGRIEVDTVYFDDKGKFKTYYYLLSNADTAARARDYTLGGTALMFGSLADGFADSAAVYK